MTSLSVPNRHTVAHRLIGQILALCGDRAELAAAQQRSWASATFSGSRHIVDILAPVTAAVQASALLPEHDFDLHGEIVADCSAQVDRSAPGETAALRVELLTIFAD